MADEGLDLMTSVPSGAARGGKAAKGAGGGYGGSTGFTNYKAREMTWEDIVLAMQLSSMCFGALLALCVVACCTYKICGPAEEIDYSPRYSVFKSEHTRLPPEILREIYTLPTSSPHPADQPDPITVVPVEQRDSLTEPNTPALRTPRLSEAGRTGSAGSILEGGFRAAVGRQETVITRAVLASHLPNGRPRGPPGGELPHVLTPPPPRRPVVQQNTRVDVYRQPRLINLNCMLEAGRPRLLTLSAMTSTRAAREVAGRGAANRLAAHDQTSSTLDLARAAAASIPSLSYTHRSLSEPQTSVV